MSDLGVVERRAEVGQRGDVVGWQRGRRLVAYRCAECHHGQVVQAAGARLAACSTVTIPCPRSTHLGRR